ncbi:MAG: MFS transporter [Candidatus Melainabacteria bacterium]|nr:MFS transporter [Candidatus Melainabacteria bacterium]
MTDQPTASPYAAIKIPDFRFLFAGKCFVTLAVQIQAMAVGWQIYELTKNPLALGMIGLTEALPSIGISLYAGHVADRTNRRMITRIAVFVVLCTIATLAGFTLKLPPGDSLTTVIFVAIAVSGFARGFYNPAMFGLLSDIVPREHYGNAAAWNSTAWQSCAMVGPILGGFLYVGFGAGWTYAAATVLCLFGLVCFSMIKTDSVIEPQKHDSIVENIKEGLNFVFSNQIVLAAMALDLFAVLFGGAVALLPIFTSEVFHMGPQALGTLRAAPSIGAFLSATYLMHNPIGGHAGRIFMAAVAGFGICMIGFGLSTNYYIALCILAVSGVLDGISVYLRSTIYQLLTPNDMKGRVAAVNSIFIGSSNEIGEFESGVACKFLGLVPSVVFGGCMTLLVVVVAFFKAPKLKKLNLEDLYKSENNS